MDTTASEIQKVSIKMSDGKVMFDANGVQLMGKSNLGIDIKEVGGTKVTVDQGMAQTVEGLTLASAYDRYLRGGMNVLDEDKAAGFYSMTSYDGINHVQVSVENGEEDSDGYFIDNGKIIKYSTKKDKSTATYSSWAAMKNDVKAVLVMEYALVNAYWIKVDKTDYYVANPAMKQRAIMRMAALLGWDFDEEKENLELYYIQLFHGWQLKVVDDTIVLEYADAEKTAKYTIGNIGSEVVKMRPQWIGISPDDSTKPLPKPEDPKPEPGDALSLDNLYGRIMESEKMKVTTVYMNGDPDYTYDAEYDDVNILYSYEKNLQFIGVIDGKMLRTDNYGMLEEITQEDYEEMRQIARQRFGQLALQSKYWLGSQGNYYLNPDLFDEVIAVAGGVIDNTSLTVTLNIRNGVATLVVGDSTYRSTIEYSNCSSHTVVIPQEILDMEISNPDYQPLGLHGLASVGVYIQVSNIMSLYIDQDMAIELDHLGKVRSGSCIRIDGEYYELTYINGNLVKKVIDMSLWQSSYKRATEQSQIVNIAVLKEKYWDKSGEIYKIREENIGEFKKLIPLLSTVVEAEKLILVISGNNAVMTQEGAIQDIVSFNDLGQSGNIPQIVLDAEVYSEI